MEVNNQAQPLQNNPATNPQVKSFTEPVLHTVEELDNKPKNETVESPKPETDYKALYEETLKKLNEKTELYNTALKENNKLYQRLTSPSPAKTSPDKDFQELIKMY